MQQPTESERPRFTMAPAEPYDAARFPQPVYSNSVNILYGPFDFVFSFRMAALATDNQSVAMLTAASVALSPQHAKVLSELLAEKVREWESFFGPLPSKDAMNDATQRATGQPATNEIAIEPQR